MPKPSILIVSIDGLRASSLGAYGNTAFATLALDQFAAESFLLDSCYAPAVDLPGIYRAMWRSVHPLRPAATGANGETLPQTLASRGYATTLVTDEPEFASIAATAQFHEVVDASAAPGHRAAGNRAADTTLTAMARLFASASDAVASKRHSGETRQHAASESAPRFVWLHCQGLYGPWDAPLALQRSLLDEGDPPPVESLVPPDLHLLDADDPDAAFRYSCAYAAQVMVLDECWRDLMEAVDSSRSRDGWLVVLIGARGYPLGEHRRVGGVDPRLYAEQLHVPWLIRFPNGLGQLGRSSALTSHLDLPPTVVGWLGDGSSKDSPTLDGRSILPLAKNARAAWREAIVAANASSRAIRTATWTLRQDVSSGGEAAGTRADPLGGELYVRPDDRWEANDVAKLCPDVVEALAQALDHARQHAERNDPIPASADSSAISESR